MRTAHISARLVGFRWAALALMLPIYGSARAQAPTEPLAAGLYECDSIAVAASAQVLAGVLAEHGWHPQPMLPPPALRPGGLATLAETWVWHGPQADGRPDPALAEQPERAPGQSSEPASVEVPVGPAPQGPAQGSDDGSTLEPSQAPAEGSATASADLGSQAQWGRWLRLRPQPRSLYGLPLWSLSDFRGDDPPSWRDELMAQLQGGIGVTRPGPHGPVIEIRYAASEIDRLMVAGEPLSAAQGQLLMPRPKPLAGPSWSHLVWRADAPGTCVALTFDACSTMDWGPYNPRVIEVLRRQGIAATLFIGGHWAQMHPEQLRLLAAEPLFELGNHTYSHPHMTQASPAVMRQQLLWAQWAIFVQTGVVPALMRPPYGEVDAAVVAAAAAVGLTTVQYDLTAGDADVHLSAQRLVQWVGDHAKAGGIVVMHMNKPGNKTAEALPGIVARLARRGLRPCQVSQLLAEAAAQRDAAPPGIDLTQGMR